MLNAPHAVSPIVSTRAFRRAWARQSRSTPKRSPSRRGRSAPPLVRSCRAARSPTWSSSRASMGSSTRCSTSSSRVTCCRRGSASARRRLRHVALASRGAAARGRRPWGLASEPDHGHVRLCERTSSQGVELAWLQRCAVDHRHLRSHPHLRGRVGEQHPQVFVDVEGPSAMAWLGLAVALATATKSPPGGAPVPASPAMTTGGTGSARGRWSPPQATSRCRGSPAR